MSETPPPGEPSGPEYSGPEPDRNARTLAMLAHLLGIFEFPGPLIIWLATKDQSPFIDDQGREALNFHICIDIAIIAALVLGFVICLFKVLVVVLWLTGVTFSILGALKASEGVVYRYPANLRFIK